MVGLSTMGMFNSCCGQRTVGGGVVPPYRRDEERVMSRVLVTKFEMETINAKNKLFKNMIIKLVDDEEN